MRLFDEDDNPLDRPYEVHSNLNKIQRNGEIIALSNGGFAVIWESNVESFPD